MKCCNKNYMHVFEHWQNHLCHLSRNKLIWKYKTSGFWSIQKGCTYMLDMVDTTFSFGRALIVCWSLKESFKVKERSLHEIWNAADIAFLLGEADLHVRPELRKMLFMSIHLFWYQTKHKQTNKNNNASRSRIRQIFHSYVCGGKEQLKRPSQHFPRFFF